MDRLDESIGPDLEPGTPTRLTKQFRGQVRVVAVVAGGGGLGAAARYGAGLLWPTGAAAFPWTTLLINLTGCALIGVLLELMVVEVSVGHQLVRAFLSTGVLGGFTTFSTYAADVERLVDVGDPRTGLIYLALTPALALVAAWLTAAATRRLVGRGRR